VTIYFAGSIRGGRDDWKIYAGVIALLLHYRPREDRKLS
jgi:hypothetical protein